MNVQVVLERLGGGGHQTMAAAQLQGEIFDNALTLLKNAGFYSWTCKKFKIIFI